jgi:hypothetical protein
MTDRSSMLPRSPATPPPPPPPPSGAPSGLAREQEIRARALYAAVLLDGPMSLTAKCNGWNGSPRDSALTVARVFEEYIRTGITEEAS